MGPLRSSTSFLLRAAACCALVYLALLPLRDALVRGIAAAAGGVLWLVDRPSVVSRLASDGDQIVIHTYLAGVEQPIGAWNGENLPVFLVAALGLALAVPVADRRRRGELVLWAALAATLVTVAAAAIQLEVATVNYAAAALGIVLVSPRGRTLLTAASQAINVVMLLLPASILLFAYVARRSPAERAGTDGARRLVPPLLAGVALVGALAGVVALQGRGADPAPALERVLALNPRAPRAFFALAAHSERAGRASRALALYERGLELAPGDALANFQTGNLLYAQGRFAAAAARYERALAAAPDDVDARYNLGNALYSAGDPAAAAVAWQELLRRTPGHVAGHENLAAAYLELDRPCDALRHLERAAALPRPQPLDAERRQQMAALAGHCPR